MRIFMDKLIGGPSVENFNIGTRFWKLALLRLL